VKCRINRNNVEVKKAFGAERGVQVNWSTFVTDSDPSVAFYESGGDDSRNVMHLARTCRTTLTDLRRRVSPSESQASPGAFVSPSTPNLGGTETAGASFRHLNSAQDNH